MSDCILPNITIKWEDDMWYYGEVGEAAGPGQRMNVDWHKLVRHNCYCQYYRKSKECNGPWAWAKDLGSIGRGQYCRFRLCTRSCEAFFIEKVSPNSGEPVPVMAPWSPEQPQEVRSYTLPRDQWVPLDATRTQGWQVS